MPDALAREKNPCWRGGLVASNRRGKKTLAGAAGLWRPTGEGKNPLLARRACGVRPAREKNLAGAAGLWRPTDEGGKNLAGAAGLCCWFVLRACVEINSRRESAIVNLLQLVFTQLPFSHGPVAFRVGSRAGRFGSFKEKPSCSDVGSHGVCWVFCLLPW
jgi:hypothetical protein